MDSNKLQAEKITIEFNDGSTKVFNSFIVVGLDEQHPELDLKISNGAKLVGSEIYVLSKLPKLPSIRLGMIHAILLSTSNTVRNLLNELGGFTVDVESVVQKFKEEENRKKASEN